MVLWGTAAVLGFATAAWVLSVVRGNATVADRAWGLTFVVLAWTYVATGPSVTARSVLAAALVTVWGLRLAVHLTLRDWGQGEDWRQREQRQRTRNFSWTSLLTVFWFQASGAVLVGLPLLAAVREGQPSSLGWLDGAGVAVWATGFLLEAVADLQLARFSSQPDNRGRVLDAGLWRYSRHPNYFGDAVMWWGLGLLGLAAGAWWALVGPATMLVILLRFSGVAVMEPHLQATRGAAHADYVARTSAFVPRPPR
jgi:steroid 5-alpha reductase family enzyme